MIASAASQSPRYPALPDKMAKITAAITSRGLAGRAIRVMSTRVCLSSRAQRPCGSQMRQGGHRRRPICALTVPGSALGRNALRRHRGAGPVPGNLRTI
jgi:hypothetical protein